MKKLYFLSFLLTSAFSFAQFNEPFTGTGALTANGWTTHSGTSGPVSIIGGSLTYPGINSTGNKTSVVAGGTEDVNKPSAAPLTGVAYFSAILNVPSTTGLHPNSATGDYFLTMSSVSGTSVTAFQGRLYIKSGTAADTFNLGVLNNSGGTATPTFSSSDLPINTPVFVVVKYDLGANSASLYINPAINGAEGTASATNATGTGAAPAQIASLAIRQGGNATTGTGTVEIDEIRLAGNYADVVSGTLSVKENNIAGLKVYPNPVTGGKFFISTDANVSKSVAIFDVLGKQVVNTTATESVNVSNLKAGVYIVKITEEGKTATRKLVIK